MNGSLRRADGLTEKRMFGGLCFLLNGHMCCGVVGDTLEARVGPDQYPAALTQPHAREMDFTGRPMRGLVSVSPEGVRTEAALEGWLARATVFAGNLPPRTPPPARRRRP